VNMKSEAKERKRYGGKKRTTRGEGM